MGKYKWFKMLDKHVSTHNATHTYAMSMNFLEIHVFVSGVQ